MTEESYIATGREFTNAGLVCLACGCAFFLVLLVVLMAGVELFS